MTLGPKAPKAAPEKVRQIEQLEELDIHNGKVIRHTLTEKLYRTDGKGVIASVVIDVLNDSVTADMPYSFSPKPKEGLADLTGFFAHVNAAASTIVLGEVFLTEEGTLNPPLGD